MEYLSRNIKIRKKDKSFDEIRVDWIDGMRLSFRFFKKNKPDEDIVINFTKEESEKIKRVLTPMQKILEVIRKNCDESGEHLIKILEKL